MSHNNAVQARQDSGIGTVVVNGAVHVARTYPKLTAAYVIGLSVLMFASGFAVDAITKREFHVQMAKVERLEATQLDKAFMKQQRAYDHYYYSKGWFSCDTTCNNNYNSYLRAQEEHRTVEAERDRLESVARKKVGIFSEYAVSDCRRQFWEYWDHGWRMAKDMSWWDAIMGVMFSRRDEDGIETILWIIGRIMWNFTVGLFMGVSGFIINLIWWVRSYEAGFMGILFFTLAACAAMSVFMSFMLGMCGVVGGGAVLIAKNAGGRSIQGGRNQNGGRYDRRNRGRQQHFIH